MKKTFAIIGIIGLSIFGLAYLRLSPTLSGASGYAAKNLCSGYFLSGFPGETVKSEALIGSADILANISYKIDETAQRVDARMFGLFPRRAVYTEGIGCTLLSKGKKSWDKTLKPLTPPTLSAQIPWPMGSAAPTLSSRFDQVIDAAFAETDPEKPRHTKAVVVIHKGQLVAERYAEGVTSKTPLLGWSMAKSVTSLVTGLLVAEGKLAIADPAPVPLWREDKTDPRGAVTLDNLLRMSSGLEFDETYNIQTDVTQMLSNEPDVAAYAAAKPLTAPVDTFWSYSSGTSNIVSGIIKNTVGGTLQDYYAYTQTRLFHPLGIRSATYEADESGNFIGSSYFYANTRDWARLGLFSLQNGQWDGEQMLPKGWMRYLVTPTPTNKTNVYGAHFWLNRNPDDTAKPRLWPNLPEDAFYMGGFQGQRVLIIPSQNLVVVRMGFSSGRNYGIEPLTAGVIALLDK